MPIDIAASFVPPRSSRLSASSSIVIEPSLTPSVSELPIVPCARLLMAEPSWFAVQYVSVLNAIASVLTRWHCSNLQLPSQPSRFVVLPSSHCSVPSRTALPHTMFWHVAEHVAVFGGSHCSPFVVLTKPSPHADVTHS